MVTDSISLFPAIPADEPFRRKVRDLSVIGLFVGLLGVINVCSGRVDQITLVPMGYLAILYGILCLADRPSALGMLILFLPLQNKGVRGIPFTVTDMMILELALTVWLQTILEGRVFRFGPGAGWILVWMSVLLISSMVSMDPGYSLRLWARTAVGVVMLILLQDHIQTRIQFHRLILWMILSSLILAGNGLAEFAIRIILFPWDVAGEFNNWIRITGILNQSNSLAWWLVLVVPWGIAAIRLAGRRRERIIWGLITLAIVSVILLTFSRGGWLGLGIVFFVAPIGRKFKIAGLVVLLAGLVALIAGVLVSTPIQANLTARGVSVERRLYRYISAPSLTAQHPVWGFGLGTYKSLDKYQPGILPPEFKGKYSHSLYITLAVETGLISTVIFVALLVRIGWKLLRALRPPSVSPEDRIRIGALLAGFAGLLTLECFHSSLPIVMFWIWMALFQVGPSIVRRESSEAIRPV